MSPRRDRVRRIRTPEEYEKWFEEESERLKLVKGDRLYAPGDPWQLNASPSLVRGKGSFGMYAQGFRDAADAVVESLLAGHLAMSDTYLFPLVAMYRHAVELSLKDVILNTQLFVEQKPAVPTTHDVEELWKLARPLIEEALPDEPKEEFDLIEDYLKESHKAAVLV